MTKSLKERLSPHLAPVATLILVTALVYVRMLGHDFQVFWDDDKYVTANPAVMGFSWDNIKTVFSSFYTGNYAPVQMLSYMADYALWGMKPSGFLLTNLTLHICNGILFYATLARLGLGRRAALVAAFVFLLHPVQVESVAWVSERKNLLSIFFSLISFLFWLGYEERGWGAGKSAYLASICAFALALLAKSVVVVFPLVLVLYQLCFRSRVTPRPLLLDKLPFAVAAAFMVWLTMEGQLPGHIPGVGGGRAGYHGGSPYATFLTMLVVLASYLKLLFWPSGLSAVYDPSIKTAPDPEVAAAALLALLLVALGVHLFRRDRRVCFCYLLFFVGLLPVSQIVPIVTLMNDRYLYLPMLGAAACVGIVAQLAGSHGGLVPKGVLGALAVALIALPLLSFSRVGVWANDLTLWRDAAEKSPQHYVALYGLAQALHNGGEMDRALPLYLEVLKRNPRHGDTLLHLGALYSARKMYLQARPFLVDVTRYYPNLAKGYADLGENYYATAELQPAEAAFKKALALQPRSRDTLLHLGVIALRGKRLDQARKCYAAAASLGGSDQNVEYNLACVEALDGAPEKALRHLQAALRLGWRDMASLRNDPDLASVRALPQFETLLQEGGR